MSTDERGESLASQAAAWVPPWERQRTPDPEYAAAAPDLTDDGVPAATDPDGDPDAGERDDSYARGAADASAVLGAAGSPGAHGADPSAAAGSPGAQGTADPSPAAGEWRAEGGNDGDEPGDDGELKDVPPELPPIPGEADGPATVDAPQVLPGESEPAPTDVGLSPDLPVPDAHERAEDEDDARSEPGSPVDAPVPYGDEGDDAGDVFDAAADDDVSDGDEVDLPCTEQVPTEQDEPDTAPEPEPEPEPEPAPAPETQTETAAVAELPIAGEAGTAGRSGPGLGIPAQGRGSKEAGSSAAGAGRRTPAGEAEANGQPPPIDDGELRAALEAILLVVDEPVAELQLAQIMEQPPDRVAGMLEDISARYTAAGHGFDLRRAAGGWRLYTRPEYAPYVERFVLDGQSTRLTQAALETLAVVAYKQPVTRSRISVIRGVNCDGVMRTLVTRGLIEECGTESETGAFLYRTTVLFLEKLGLNSVDQLPPLAPFLPDDVEEVIDAQR